MKLRKKAVLRSLVVSLNLNFYSGLKILKIEKICTNNSVAGYFLRQPEKSFAFFKLSIKPLSHLAPKHQWSTKTQADNVGNYITLLIPPM